MRPLQLLVPALSAAGAVWLLGDPRAGAFVTTGDVLALGQRDVRVHNNFGDPQANSNGTSDPSFPGYVGAPLAIWKACVEWGSEPHHEGYGDPKQPGGLGSGGANFDCTWQGLAGSVGGINDNIHSEISGSGGGVLAFCESPTSDGWRIRYYASWTWHDDPFGTVTGGGQADLQGVAAHEYGHALGLGHSNVGTATMFATVPFDMTDWRTIEADDIAGVQAIYGPKSSAKPHVATYSLPSPGMVAIHGTGFAASGNEVWFTQAGGNPSGDPVTARGLSSSAGGTLISFSLPPAAGPGDLLVHVPGAAHDTLSNAFPFNPAQEPCFVPKAYGQGKLNSSGGVAAIGWQGMPSLASNALRISVDACPGSQKAILFHGGAATSVPFLGGELLVARPLQRGPAVVLDPFGSALFQVPIDAGMVGTTRFYQVWFEDPLDPFGAGTSDALEVAFCN